MLSKNHRITFSAKNNSSIKGHKAKLGMAIGITLLGCPHDPRLISFVPADNQVGFFYSRESIREL
jgi:hypothetical protein